MILYAEGDWDELRICRVEAFLASYLPKPMGFSVFQFIMHILGTIAESPGGTRVSLHIRWILRDLIKSDNSDLLSIFLYPMFSNFDS